MKMKLSLLIVIAIVITSCNSTKKAFTKSGNNQDDAIQTAFLDFSTIRKLYKKDSVFSVDIKGLVNNTDLMVVGIRKSNRKLLLTIGAKAGSTGKLPSRYFEKDGVIKIPDFIIDDA